jgi:hypothetical protein
MKYISYLLIVSFVISSYLLGSLVEGTLVKTPNGLVPIEKLNVGDDVMSYGPHKTIKPVKILRITKEIAPSRLIIVTEQGSFVAAKDQFFYSDTYYWVAATAISDEHALLDVNSQVNQCGNSFIVNEDTTIYKVTIEFPHVLFISDLQIVTHNFLPPIAIGVSLAFGIGEGSLCTGVGLSCGALAVWKLLTGSKAAEVTLQLNNSDYHRGRKEKINTSLPSNSPEDPEDKYKERKKNETTKTEFFKKIKDKYEYWHNKIYRKKSGMESIEGAEYLQWDNQHQDVEAYSKSEKHLGSIDPQTLKLYKPAKYGRRFPQ